MCFSKSWWDFVEQFSITNLQNLLKIIVRFCWTIFDCQSPKEINKTEIHCSIYHLSPTFCSQPHSDIFGTMNESTFYSNAYKVFSFWRGVWLWVHVLSFSGCCCSCYHAFFLLTRLVQVRIIMWILVYSFSNSTKDS